MINSVSLEIPSLSLGMTGMRCSVSLEIPSLSLGMTSVKCDQRHCDEVRHCEAQFT